MITMLMIVMGWPGIFVSMFRYQTDDGDDNVDNDDGDDVDDDDDDDDDDGDGLASRASLYLWMDLRYLRIRLALPCLALQALATKVSVEKHNMIAISKHCSSDHFDPTCPIRIWDLSF